MKYTLSTCISVLMICTIPFLTRAAVVDSSANGFTVKIELLVNVSTDSLYTYLVRDVGKWWDPEHTYSDNASNLSIQPVINGCFCENLGNGGFVRHMTVVYVNPGQILRLEGGLGPLQELAVTGSMTFMIIPDALKTKLSFHYTVGGYFPGGASAWATMVDKVLGEQLKRLKDFAEKRKK